MRNSAKAFLHSLLLASPLCFGASAAQAQVMALWGAATIALKSNETVEVQELYYVINCRSLLTSPVEVEVLDGPPTVSASIKEAMVLPRTQNCSKRVSGGKLYVTSKDIDDPSFTRLTLRLTYKTKDGERKFSHVYNLQLLP